MAARLVTVDGYARTEMSSMTTLFGRMEERRDGGLSTNNVRQKSIPTLIN